MHLLLLGLRNLRRNRRRTLLTALSLAVSMFLFVTLASILVTLDAAFAAAGRLPLMIVMHKGGFTHDMPESHAARLRAQPGVRAAVPMLYYGGIYGEVAGPQDTFPSFAADTVPELRGLWGEDLKVTDADWQTWYGDRTAALVGPQLMRKYGWSRGQRIVLRGTLRPVDLELVIAGPISVHTDHATVFLHREYLEEALGRPGLATMFWVQLDDAGALAAVGARIDAEMAASPAPTRSVSMKQMLQQVIGMLGDVRTAVTGIAVLVMLAVLFVALNAAALTARERTTEVALLKALGFTGRDVFFSMLVESVSVALAGGALGCAAAWALFRFYTLGLGFGPLSGFQVPAGAVPIGLAASALIGALAALLPGLRAARVPVVQALRRTS